MNTSDEILRDNEDILNICIHEAAHLIALRHYGGDGVIHVYPNINGQETGVYGSDARCSGKVELTQQPSGDPLRSALMLGLSGMCGEIFFKNENPDWLWQDLMDSWNNNREAWSDADVNIATSDSQYIPEVSDFEECAELIIEKSDEIKALALEAFFRTMGVAF